jgi:hypothetical protein
VNPGVFAQALGHAMPAAMYFGKCHALEEAKTVGCCESTELQIVAASRSWREIFLWETGNRHKERKKEVYR